MTAEGPVYRWSHDFPPKKSDLPEIQLIYYYFGGAAITSISLQKRESYSDRVIDHVQVAVPRVAGWRRAMVSLAALWALLAAAYLSFHMFSPFFIAIYLTFVVLAGAPAATTKLLTFRNLSAFVVFLLVLASFVTMLFGGLLFLPAALPLLLAILPMSGKWPAAVLSALSALLLLGAYLTYDDLTREPNCFRVTVPEGHPTPQANLGDVIGLGVESVSYGYPEAALGYAITVDHHEDLAPSQQAALEQRLHIVFPRATAVYHCTSDWERGPIRPIDHPSQQ